MFSNALLDPSNQPSMSPRRCSQFGMVIEPELSQRRATMPVIDVAGMSPGLSCMISGHNDSGPSTPWFVTPTKIPFSGRRFSFDSPMQTLTAMSRAHLPTINRKAAKRAWAKMSTKKRTRSFKNGMVLILISFVVILFLTTKSIGSSCKEGTGMCETWEARNHENKPEEEFMEQVSTTENYHILEDQSEFWLNRWADQDVEEITDSNKDTESESSATPNESQLNVEQEPLGLDKLPSKITDYVESVRTFIGDTISGIDSKQEQPESAESKQREDVSSRTIEDPPSEVNDEEI